MIPLFVSFVLRIYLYTNIFQQSFYEYKNVLRFYIKHFIFFFLSTVFFIINFYFNNIVITILEYFVIGFESVYFISKIKIPLNITKRVIRLWVVVIILYIPFFLLKYFYLVPTLLIAFLYISNIINKPIEKIINKKYLTTAKNKYYLSECKKIGITGSYGKTSVKNYLKETLMSRYLVLESPKSYNTPLGIAKFINQSNLEMLDFLILEFGARRVDDIKELGNLYKIDIAIVTEIGLMHIDTFKTLDNIINEKMRILSYLSDDGFAILNYENEFIRNYKVSCKKYTYGFDYGDFQAKNISLSIFGLSFDLIFNNEFVKRIELKILGRQSILNIMPSIIMCYLNNIPLDSISVAKSVSNRLSLRKFNDFYILDDGYNSNVLGAKYALEVLRSYHGKKFLITPGFAEMNKEKDTLLVLYSKEINKGLDCCILVKNDFTKKLADYISFDIKVIFVGSFIEGFNLFRSMKTDNSILLIENDLPDAF